MSPNKKTGLSRTVALLSGGLIAAMLLLAAMVWMQTAAIADHAVQVEQSRAPQLMRIAELELAVTRASLELRHAILAGVGQVGQADTQMDQATQQNAALVEQSAAAAAALQQQAGRLVESVSTFKLA